jgi:hypothetical protein
VIVVVVGSSLHDGLHYTRLSLTITYYNIPCFYNREQGRIIGGTKGNKFLDFVSGAPVKERVIDRIPNIFDYDELSKYGYSVRLFLLGIAKLAQYYFTTRETRF